MYIHFTYLYNGCVGFNINETDILPLLTMPYLLLWAIGLFEGEGSISISHKKHYCYLQLDSTDEDVINRFHRAVGVGTVKCVGQRPHQTKPVWKWRVGNREDVTKLLESFLPFLGERRALKAQNVFDYYDHCYSVPVPN